ncbi:hypothetical protein BJX64DRAFT_80569 [Aspergillus heterothallicus]
MCNFNHQLTGRRRVRPTIQTYSNLLIEAWQTALDMSTPLGLLLSWLSPSLPTIVGPLVYILSSKD